MFVKQILLIAYIAIISNNLMASQILKGDDLVKFFSNKDGFKEDKGKFYNDYIKITDDNFLKMGKQKDFELSFDIDIKEHKTACFFLNIKRIDINNYIRVMVYNYPKKARYLQIRKDGRTYKKNISNFKFSKNNNIYLKVYKKNLTFKINGKLIFSGKINIDNYSLLSMQLYPKKQNKDAINISNVKFNNLTKTITQSTISGSPLDNMVLYSENQKNYIMDFGGNKSYIKFDTRKIKPLTEFTLEGWVLYRKIQKYSNFLKFGNRLGFDSLLAAQHKESDNLFLRVPGSYNSFKQNRLSCNTWNHIAISVKDKHATFYYNGDNIWESDMKNDFNLANNFSATLGATGIKKIYKSYIDGKMENFRIWNAALTKEEISDVRIKNIKSAKGLLINNSFDNKLIDCKKYGDSKMIKEELPWNNEY